MKKNVAMVILSIAIFVIGNLGIVVSYKDLALQEAKEECIQKAINICERYDIETIDVSINDSFSAGDRHCKIKVIGTGADSLSSQDLRLCISEINDLDIDIDRAFLLSSYINFDGVVYSSDTSGHKGFSKGQLTGAEKAFLRDYANEHSHVDSVKKYTKDTNDDQRYSYGSNSYNSYDDGYDDIYEDDDYDWDRYYSDSDYADGVDDAMDEMDW